MLSQSQPNRHLRSRRISGVRSLTDLTALAIFRLSVSPIQGITAHSASSGQGETRLLSHPGVVMPRRGLLTNGDDIGMRLSGIDAPEIAGKCAKEKALALVTRDFLRGQLAGASVLQQQVFGDRFFRIEATVIANGVNINQLMVKKGFAALYTVYGHGPTALQVHTITNKEVRDV
jgi:endonuclease YncB( thermonuclease family)